VIAAQATVEQRVDKSIIIFIFSSIFSSI